MRFDFDTKPLAAFFAEVKEQLGIQLTHNEENEHFPIQLSEPDNGISRSKWYDLIQFIKLQTDLRENAIGKIHPIKNSQNISIELSLETAKALSEVYALSFFYTPDDGS